MENATENNGMILNIGTFAGLVKSSKDNILTSLYANWEMAIRSERRSYMQAMHETDTAKADEKARLSNKYRQEVRTLEDIMRSLLASNAKGEFVEGKWDDAYDSLQATRYKIEEDAQDVYARRLQAEKEEALKAEYMAGFEAWKATQAGA